MSAFDPNAFLNATITEVSKKRPPIDAGEYNAVLGEGKVLPWSSKDGTKSGWKYEAPITIDVPADMQSRLGLTQPTITLTYSCMLDITPAGGFDLSPGRNAGLRKLRDALDMNKEGQPFSFTMTWGRPVKVLIKHEDYQGEPQERVDALRKI